MVIVCARYHLLCLSCCICRAQLVMRFYYTNFCSKLVSRIHINLFNSLSFHLISQKPFSLNVVFDANALFRLYLMYRVPITANVLNQHKTIAEAPTFPLVTFYDKNKVQIGNLQSGDKRAAEKLTVVYTSKTSKIELKWIKKYCIDIKII